MNLRNLREQRDTVAKRLRNLLDKHPGALWTNTQQADYDKDIGELDRVDNEISRTQRILDLDADKKFDDARRAIGIENEDEDDTDLGKFDQSLILSSWGKRRAKGEGARAIRAVNAAWLRGHLPQDLQMKLAAHVRNTMSTTTTTEGGYTVPSLISSEIVDSLKDFSGMRQVAEVFKTDAGNPLSYPSSDGTAETGELIAENTTATGADIVFGTVSLNTFKYSSKIIAIPFELLQDTTIDMEGLVRRRIAQRIGRITNTHFTTGTGTGQPRGVIVGAGTGKTGLTGQTLTVIFDDLVDVIRSVDVAYRQGGQCKWMMRDASMGIVNKLKDTAGRPIFIPGWDGLGKAAPDSILGYPVQINNDVAAMAANAKSIAFGDFSYYKIRDAMGLTLFRFTDSAYAKLGQVGFLAWQRSGGNLVDTGAVKLYVNSAT
jgi:HK97 family phage major capsid protein